MMLLFSVFLDDFFQTCNLTSICLSLKTELMPELKEAPENMEVTG